MKQIPDIRTLKNILIMRPEGSLGDAIMSTCCYREIKRVNPSIKITVACFGNSYDFLKVNPYIDKIFKIPIRTRIRRHQHWPTLIWTGLKLRRCHFDLVLDSCSKTALNYRLCKWLAASGRLLDRFTCPVQPFGAMDKHGSEHECSILRLLGIKNPSPHYDLPIPSADRQTITAWLEQEKLDRFILFNPFGSVDKHSFNPQTAEHLYKLLKTWNLPWVVPLASSSYERGKQLLGRFPNVFIKQTKNVFELFELVRRAQAVVTPDTSVVHISTGFEKHCLTFYNTPTAYALPNNPKAHVIKTALSDINTAIDWHEVEQAIDQIKHHLHP